MPEWRDRRSVASSRLHTSFQRIRVFPSSPTHPSHWLALGLLVGLVSLGCTCVRQGAGDIDDMPSKPGLAFQTPLGKGINLNGWLNVSPPEGRCWKDSLTQRQLGELKSLGFSFVRTPVDPEPLMRSDGLDGAALACLDRALDLVLSQELAVIVDLHPKNDFKRSILESDSALEAYAQFLNSLAAHLASYDREALALETLNEPFDPGPGSSEWDWNGIQRRLWAAARRGAPGHTLVVTGDSWSRIEGLTRVELLPDTNLIYTFHFYEPELFTHQGANWGSFARGFFPFLVDIPYPSSRERMEEVIPRIVDAIQDDDVRAAAKKQLEEYAFDPWNKQRIHGRISIAARWADSLGVHGLAGEFGVYRPKAPQQDRAAWLHDVREVLEEFGLGWAMWEHRGGFGLLDADQKVDSAVAAALGLRRE
jgi:hypothetical protein